MLLRNEGSIKRPRGLSVLYCPFSDGTPFSVAAARTRDIKANST